MHDNPVTAQRAVPQVGAARFTRYTNEGVYMIRLTQTVQSAG